MKLLLCEICRTPLAQFDPVDLSVPLTGAMFKPLYLDRECPPTFHPSVTQEDIVCPMCLRRPFNDPHKLLTYEGWHEVKDKVKEIDVDYSTKLNEIRLKDPSALLDAAQNVLVPFQCPHCLKVCKSQAGLVAHMRKKHKESHDK